MTLVRLSSQLYTFNTLDALDLPRDRERSYPDPTCRSGLAVLIVSNYTVLVWAVVDLVLIFSSRNLSSLAENINLEISAK